MPRTLADIFSENPTVEVVEVLGYEDNTPFGLSPDKRKLKIFDAAFAEALAGLPNADTEGGHITTEGYCIHGRTNILQFACEAIVNRKTEK